MKIGYLGDWKMCKVIRKRYPDGVHCPLQCKLENSKCSVALAL